LADCWKVIWSKRVEKQIQRLPKYIQERFNVWTDAIRLEGMRHTRRQPGYHDEPLTGNRKGQRSVRLNRSYRAIYVERTEGCVELIEVIEVNKHGY
jgi:proteic killer suppression protein